VGTARVAAGKLRLVNKRPARPPAEMNALAAPFVPGRLAPPAVPKPAAPLLLQLPEDVLANQVALVSQPGGLTLAAPRKYHDEMIPLAFIHTKYGEPIVIMVFRRAMQQVFCLTPPPLAWNPPRSLAHRHSHQPAPCYRTHCEGSTVKSQFGCLIRSI
jgi:hypothetical protein